MAIGAGWAEGAWIDAGWNAGAWGEAVEDVVSPVAGWADQNWYDAYREKKQDRDEEHKRVIESFDDLEETDAEIANFLHKQLERDARNKEISALEEMVRSTYTPKQAERAKQYSKRVAKAYIRAATQGNFSAVEAFEREMDRAREEEEFLMIAMMLLN